MSVKELTDAELNEACARIVKSRRFICKSPYVLGYKFCAGTPCGEKRKQSCAYRKRTPAPNYCYSAEAQAELEKWLWKRKVPYGSGYKPSKNIFRAIVADKTIEAATEGRALCEAFCLAFGEKEKK